MKSRSMSLAITLACALFAGSCGYSHVADFGEATLITRLEIHDGQNGLLWRIDAMQPKPVFAVDYGFAPPGFVQIFPTTGSPRNLREGEPLLLVYTTAATWTRHEGVAVGKAAFKGGGWHSGPLDRTSPDQVFVSTRMPISDLVK